MPNVNQTNWTDIPSWSVGNLIGPSGSITQETAAHQQFPTLAELPGTIPTLGVPDLSPEQLQLLQQLQQSGASQPDLQSARDQLTQLTSGPIGSSPATTAGMEAFQQLTLPQIMQAQALQGTATGGAALEAASQGATAAAVPLIQQEISNRQQAVGQYGQIDQQQLQGLAASLEAAGLPREVALEQAQAAYDAAQQKFQFQAGIQLGPLQYEGALMPTHGRGGTTQTGMDYIGAIAKGISPNGLIGSLTGGGGK